jgi:hypothetical protein
MRSERIYRRLLHAFPAGFRAEYETEMVRDFAELRRRRGFGPAWARVLFDLMVAAPLQHAETLLGDLRDSARRLRSSPGLVLLVMLTLGLGVGANTAIYSLTDALLFRPLPAPEPERLALPFRSVVGSNSRAAGPRRGGAVARRSGAGIFARPGAAVPARSPRFLLTQRQFSVDRGHRAGPLGVSARPPC